MELGMKEKQFEESLFKDETDAMKVEAALTGFVFVAICGVKCAQYHKIYFMRADEEKCIFSICEDHERHLKDFPSSSKYAPYKLGGEKE